MIGKLLAAGALSLALLSPAAVRAQLVVPVDTPEYYSSLASRRGRHGVRRHGRRHFRRDGRHGIRSRGRHSFRRGRVFRAAPFHGRRRFRGYRTYPGYYHGYPYRGSDPYGRYNRYHYDDRGYYWGPRGRDDYNWWSSPARTEFRRGSYRGALDDRADRIARRAVRLHRDGRLSRSHLDGTLRRLDRTQHVVRTDRRIDRSRFNSEWESLRRAERNLESWSRADSR